MRVLCKAQEIFSRDGNQVIYEAAKSGRLYNVWGVLRSPKRTKFLILGEMLDQYGVERPYPDWMPEELFTLVEASIPSDWKSVNLPESPIEGYKGLFECFGYEVLDGPPIITDNISSYEGITTRDRRYVESFLKYIESAEPSKNR